MHYLDIIVTWVVNHWPALVALAGGGTSLSILLELILHKLHIDSKKLAYALIHLLSLAGAFASYYLDNTTVLPVYAGLVIAAQTVHRFVVSPYYTKYVLPYLTFLSENADAAIAPSRPVQTQPLEETPAASFVN